jgi:hypothetical protein
MSDERKVILAQCSNADGPLPEYEVVELQGTVEFNIKQHLTKRDVEELIRRPRYKVIVRATKGVHA